MQASEADRMVSVHFTWYGATKEVSSIMVGRRAPIPCCAEFMLGGVPCIRRSLILQATVGSKLYPLRLLA